MRSIPTIHPLVLLVRSALVALALVLLATACQPEETEDSSPAEPVPTRPDESRIAPVHIFDGREVAERLGISETELTNWVAFDPEGLRALADAAADPTDDRWSEIQDVDLTESFVVATNSETCVYNDAYLSVIDGEIQYIVDVDDTFSCVRANYQFAVFVLPHDLGFDEATLPEIRTIYT